MENNLIKSIEQICADFFKKAIKAVVKPKDKEEKKKQQ